MTASLLLVEGLPAPPRPLGLRATARTIGHELRSSVKSMVGGIFLLIGLAISVSFGAAYARDYAFRHGGRPTIATVVGRYASTQRDGDGEHRVHQVELSFPLADGRQWTALRDVKLATWNRLRTGDRLAVNYDPRNPDRSVLLREGSDWVPLAGFGFGATFVMLGALILGSGLREVIRPLRLYRAGAATTGEVDALELVDNETLNGLHPTRVRYHFRDRDGAEHRGATKTLDVELLEAVHEGALVTVLYDPGRPTRNTLLAALGLTNGADVGQLRAGDSEALGEARNGQA